MAAAADMPNIKSGKILHISELNSWAPDEIHGNSVRVLGRVKQLNAVNSKLTIEYHGEELVVDSEYLKAFGKLRPGTLLEFLGELEKSDGEMTLKARVCRYMEGLDTDLYDRCLKIRRDFENNVLRSKGSQA